MKPAGLSEKLVYGTSRPGYPKKSVSKGEILNWINQNSSQGIKAIICLLCEEEIALYYQEKLLDLYRKHFISVFHFPWDDFSLCSEETIKRIIKVIEKETHKGHKVLVHCSGGIGRTGLTLAAWLVYRYKISPEKAIEIQLSLGRNPLESALINEEVTEEAIIDLLEAIL